MGPKRQFPSKFSSQTEYRNFLRFRQARRILQHGTDEEKEQVRIKRREKRKRNRKNKSARNEAARQMEASTYDQSAQPEVRPGSKPSKIVESTRVVSPAQDRERNPAKASEIVNHENESHDDGLMKATAAENEALQSKAKLLDQAIKELLKLQPNYMEVQQEIQDEPSKRNHVQLLQAVKGNLGEQSRKLLLLLLIKHFGGRCSTKKIWSVPECSMIIDSIRGRIATATSQRREANKEMQRKHLQLKNAAAKSPQVSSSTLEAQDRASLVAQSTIGHNEASNSLELELKRKKQEMEDLKLMLELKHVNDKCQLLHKKLKGSSEAVTGDVTKDTPEQFPATMSKPGVVNACQNEQAAKVNEAAATLRLESSSSNNYQETKTKNASTQAQQIASYYNGEIAIGTVVEKNFPGEGRYSGKVVDNKVNDDSNLYEIKYVGKSRSEKLKREEVRDIVVPPSKLPLFEFEEFHEMWEELEPEKIEKSSKIRQANSKISRQDLTLTSQTNAQYGRLLPDAIDKIFLVLNLGRLDIFLDIGHGIAYMPLQASYCVGCEARGIELVPERFEAGLELADRIHEKTNTMFQKGMPGQVDLRNGDLTDPGRHNWMVKANKLVVNNYNGVYSERMGSSKSPHYHLDHYVAGLFASLEVGSILVTLCDLQLGPTQSEVKAIRKNNKWPLCNTLNGSYFEMVIVDIGVPARDGFSWSSSGKDTIKVFVYKRVKQNSKNGAATIMCCNRNCKQGEKGTLIQAVKVTGDGKAVLGTCTECNYTCRTKRNVKPVLLHVFLDPAGPYADWGRS